VKDPEKQAAARFARYVFCPNLLHNMMCIVHRYIFCSYLTGQGLKILIEMCFIISIKDKVNNPPTEIDSQAIPRRAQELKNAIEKFKDIKPRKRNKHKKEGLIDTTTFEKNYYKLPGMKRKEKPVPVFKQFVGETAKSFMHRITMKCQVHRGFNCMEHYSFNLCLKISGSYPRVSI
jgi:hypothetical protein